MSVQLLDKTRKINKLLHNNDSRMVVFNDICGVLSEILDSNIIVLSKKGKVLGIKNRDDIPAIRELIKDNVGSYIDSDLNERLLSILSTKENVNLITLGFEFKEVNDYQAIIIPIDKQCSKPITGYVYRNDDSLIIINFLEFKAQGNEVNIFFC